MIYFFGCLDWPQEETEVTGEGGNTHLWEESWDDDDTSEDFSKQLKWVYPEYFYTLKTMCQLLSQAGARKGQGQQSVESWQI